MGLSSDVGLGLVFDTGNPWIFLGLSISIPVKIHTRGPRVWILTGLAQGTATGTKSMDTGTDFYTRRDTMNFFYYATMDQSSSDQTSSFFASGKDAAAFRSSFLIKSILPQ